MKGQGGELVATDKPTVVTKPLLDAVVVKDGQSNRRLADPAGTDESNWSKIFCKADDPLDQLVAPKTCPRWRGR